MRILFVSTVNIFATGSSNIRNISLINGLLQNGHSVELLTFSVNDNAANLDETFEKALQGVKIISVNNSSMQKKFALKSNKAKQSIIDKLKLKAYLVLRKIYVNYFCIDTLMNAVKLVPEESFPEGIYDIIISSSDPVSSHELARRVKAKNPGAKWIQYWGDPLSEDITRSKLLSKRLKKYERELLNAADKVVYTNELVEKHQKKNFEALSSKITYLPTPFVFYEDRKEKSRYTMGYFGSFNSIVRNIEPLCETATRIRESLIIIGDGDQRIKENEFVEKRSTSKLDEVQRYENLCEILVCLCNERKGRKCLQIPGKIYHYAVTNKPIMVIGADEDTKKFLMKYHRFHFAENTTFSIEKCVEEIREGCDWISNEPIKEFRADEVARKFVEV